VAPGLLVQAALCFVSVGALLLGCGPRGALERGDLTLNSLTASGVEAFCDGRYEEAERLLRSAVAHDYGDSLARFYLAKAYLARGTPAGRIAAEETLSDLNYISTDPLYVETLVRLRLRQGYDYNVKRGLERLSELRPGDPETYYQLGWISEGDWWRFQAGEDRERALEYYGRTLTADPTNRGALVRLAVLAVEADSLRDAGGYVERLARAHPEDLTTQLLLGVMYEKRGEFEAAEALLRQAVAGLPIYEQVAFCAPEFLVPDSAHADDEPLDDEERGEGIGDGPGFDDARLDGTGPAGSSDGAFWIERDPTPTTPTNERFVKHASRMAMADFLYGDPVDGIRGWETLPGEYYVRYGKPVHRRYVLGVSPMWIHTFDMGPSGLVSMRFVDYAQSGDFIIPIEYRGRDAPLHEQLAYHHPEAGHLEPEIAGFPMDHSVAWFRTASGEPRLHVAVAAPTEPLICEASVRDMGQREIYRSSELFRATALPPELGLPGMGIFVAKVYPGREGAEIRLAVAGGGRVEATLSDPPPPAGFAMSDLVLGFVTSSGLLPNPGFAYGPETTVGVFFELYGVRRDALGVGYARIKLSVVPISVKRGGVVGRFAQSLLGPGRTPSFITSETEENVRSEIWQRTMRIEPSELKPGRYRVEVEVRDRLSGEELRREAEFELGG
jgi:tetratricopeptide (TPR) repeat protein